MLWFNHFRSWAASGTLALGLLAGSSPLAWGQDKAEKASPVALRKVVLFNAGVGYFEHRGTVTGNTAVDLKFNVDDINDLLKSMVLQDEGGGRISTVTYGSRDPITRTLKTFGIDLTTNPTLADILNQVRGEEVVLEVSEQKEPVSGTIVGTEKRTQRIGDKAEPVEVIYLNILTEEGLRSIRLTDIIRIKLQNEQLAAEFRQALAVLAKGHSTDKKTVTLNFLGQDERAVRVGYIQETPVWKTSYRLVLKDDAEPHFQGWAIVENTTEEDWSNVDLALVSGRPISFVMDLYQPLYVERPVVVQELYASLRPQRYDQDLAAANEEFLRKADTAALAAAPAPPAPGAAFAGKAMEKRNAAQNEQAARRGADRNREPIADLDARQGMSAMAQGGEVGEMFKYDIETPVTLERQKSAMLPIVNEKVQGEKLSIYNQNVQAKHPLAGLRFKNSTDLHLMQGPITVFDDGAYAGDAQIDDLPPGTERLISYALDLDIEVAPQTHGHPEQLVDVKLVKGTLYTSRKYIRETRYIVKNSGKRPKKVLIESPLDPSWKLVEPTDPAEKTRDKYRFAVTAAPGEPVTLKVVEQMTQGQSIALSNIDDGTIVFYTNQQVVSQKVKDLLREVIRRKQAINEVTQARNGLQQQINVINEEQNRIRQNMAQLDRTNELYQKYVKKLTEQEDLNDKVRGKIQELNDKQQSLQKALDEFLIEATAE